MTTTSILYDAQMQQIQFQHIVPTIMKSNHSGGKPILQHPNSNPNTRINSNEQKNQFLHSMAYRNFDHHYQNKEKGKEKETNWRYAGTNGGLSYEEELGGRDSRICKKIGEDSRTSAFKIYEHNGHFQASSQERMTFGPDNFKLKPQLKVSENQQNPELILPITHKDKNITKPLVKINDKQTRKRPKIYQIMQKELGISEQRMSKLKQETLNYELEQFVKKKGLEYLQQNNQRNRSRKTKTEASYKSEDLTEKKKVRSRLQKYPNYIPQVFPKIEKRHSSKKTLLSSRKNPSKQPLPLPKRPTRKQTRINSLNDQQQMLGKMVYDKVQDYFKLDQENAGYFQKVKSEEKIDEAWIQYLRTKVNRADLIFNQQ